MARKRSPVLTDAESRVMQVLWDRGKGTVAQVVAGQPGRHAVSYSTIQTLLRILEGKGYVAHEKSGRAFVYRPVVDRKQARLRALRHLVTRLFNDSPSLLVLNVLEDNEIEPGELAQLKKLVENA